MNGIVAPQTLTINVPTGSTCAIVNFRGQQIFQQQTAVQTNASTVNTAIQGDNNNVSVSTNQQNINYQLQQAQEIQTQQELQTITTLPKTGADNGYLSPLENTMRFLSPVTGTSGSSAIPGILLSGFLTTIGSIGIFFGRKLFL
jgi:hypothetical protein